MVPAEKARLPRRDRAHPAQRLGGIREQAHGTQALTISADSASSGAASSSGTRARRRRRSGRPRRAPQTPARPGRWRGSALVDQDPDAGEVVPNAPVQRVDHLEHPASRTRPAARRSGSRASKGPGRPRRNCARRPTRSRDREVGEEPEAVHLGRERGQLARFRAVERRAQLTALERGAQITSASARRPDRARARALFASRSRGRSGDQAESGRSRSPAPSPPESEADDRAARAGRRRAM